MPKTDCEDLVREGTEASKHSLTISASLFEDAAKCYDDKGDRKKAGQYLTLAGDFFLDLKNREKAAVCYGKAIMRHLMIDDIETAEILLEKGKEYGFSSTTHQYRIALDALERQTQSKIEEEEETEEAAIEVEALPDIDILPIEEEEELIPLNHSLLISEEEAQPIKKDYLVPQLENEESSTLSSFAVLAAISKATREEKYQNIQTNAVVKDKEGGARFIDPEVTLNPFKSIETSIEGIEGDDTLSSSVEAPKSTDELKQDTASELTTADVLKSTDNLDLDYVSKTELTNVFEEELFNIEIVNTIPFQWEVVDVKTDFKLEEKTSSTDGLVFTWRKDQIEPGEKIAVEYILRKRVERSIILRKENKVSVISSFHSVKQDLEARIDFVNTTGMVLREILIEDVIPPELIVKQSEPSFKIKPINLPTPESTLYRWIFSSLNPGDNFSVFYRFHERPLTRHYKDEVECVAGVIKIEKISQPIVDSKDYEYLWYYSISNPITEKITLTDRIPSDFNITMVDPTYLKPAIGKEKAQKLLSWQLKPEDKFTSMIIRINGSESFTALAPTVELSQLGEFQLVDRMTISEKKLIDLRRLREISSRDD